MSAATQVLLANVPTMFVTAVAGALAYTEVTAWAWGPLIILAFVMSHTAKSGAPHAD